MADLEYFQNNAKTKPDLIAYLQSLIKAPFARCSYTQAI